MKNKILIPFFLLFVTLASAQKSNKIVIRGFIANPKNVDSVTIVIWKNYYGKVKRYLLSHKQTKLRLNNPSGYFEYTDTISGPVYLTIGQKFVHFGHIDDGIYGNYIGEPGDSITIFNFGGDNALFYGRGKEKYEARYALDQKTAFNNLNSVDTTAQLWVLNQYKRNLSPFIYEVLFQDIIGKRLEAIIKSLTAMLVRKDMIAFNKSWPDYQRLLKQFEAVSNQTKIFSSTYCSVKIWSEILLHSLSKEGKPIYTSLKKKHKGLLREKVITAYLSIHYERMENSDSLIYDALQFITDPDYKSELQKISNTLTKGSPAYNFSLSDENGKTVTLNDFVGKVVFIDFWFTGCKACVIYHKEILAPIIKSYTGNKNIVFLTISIDATREMWLASIKGGEYTSPSSINLYTNGEGGNHPVIKKYNVNSFPRPLLIDKNGKILSSSNLDLRIDPEKFKQLLQQALAQ